MFASTKINFTDKLPKFLWEKLEQFAEKSSVLASKLTAFGKNDQQVLRYHNLQINNVFGMTPNFSQNNIRVQRDNDEQVMEAISAVKSDIRKLISQGQFVPESYRLFFVNEVLRTQTIRYWNTLNQLIARIKAQTPAEHAQLDKQRVKNFPSLLLDTINLARGLEECLVSCRNTLLKSDQSCLTFIQQARSQLKISIQQLIDYAKQKQIKLDGVISSCGDKVDPYLGLGIKFDAYQAHKKKNEESVLKKQDQAKKLDAMSVTISAPSSTSKHGNAIRFSYYAKLTGQTLWQSPQGHKNTDQQDLIETNEKAATTRIQNNSMRFLAR